MGVTSEVVKLRVPAGEGHFVGDLLRKYAIRCGKSWQPIAYKLDNHAKNIGLPGGSLLDYTELYSGYIEHDDDSYPTAKVGDVRVVDFVLSDGVYQCGSMRLVGINPAVGDCLKVCIRFDSGHVDAETNYEYLEEAFPSGVSGYLSVPSKHTDVKRFRFKIEPIDTEYEDLVIDADNGVAEKAYSHALRTLKAVAL